MGAAKTLKQWKGEGWAVRDGALMSDGRAPLLAKHTPEKFVLETEILEPRRFRILLARDERDRLLAFEADRRMDRARFLLLDEVDDQGVVLKENRLGYSLMGDRSNGRVMVRVTGDRKIFRIDLNNNPFSLDLSSDDQPVGAKLLGSLGTFGAAPGKFGYPIAVTGDETGDVYVLDQHNNRVSRFSDEGEFRDMLQLESRSDDDDTRYNQYRGLVRAPDGDFLTIDTRRAEILRFDSRGRFKNSVGGTGAGQGHLFTAYAVGVDDNGDIIVCDPHDRAFHRFDGNGNFLARVGEKQFGHMVYCLAGVGDGEGGMYLLEGNRQEIHHFDANNNRRVVFGGRGSGDGRFIQLWDVTADREGNLYITDPSDHGLHKLAADGTFLWRVGGPDQLIHPSGVAVDQNGDVLVMDSRNRVVKFSAAGKRLGEFEFDAGAGDFKRFTLAVGGRGEIHVGDDANSRIWKFDSSGEYIRHWGRRGTEEGFLANPGGIAVDANGNVLVADSANHRIQIFSRDGEFIRSLGSMGAENGRFRTPRDIGLDQAGNIFVLDTSNNRVQKLTPEGVFVKAWNSDSRGPYRHPQHFHVFPDGGYVLSHNGYGTLDHYDSSGGFRAGMAERGSGKGRFQSTGGMARLPGGEIVVLDPSSYRVTRFASDGRFLNEFGAQGGTPGKFQYPLAMAADEHSRVYVLDNQYRLHVFSAAGEFLRSVGLPRVNTGQNCMAVDGAGNIYCLEISGHLVMVFNPSGQALRQWGGAGTTAGKFQHPRGIAITGEGEIAVSDSNNARVQVFDTHGNFIREFGRRGAAPGRFRQVTSLHLNQRDEIIASDNQDGIIQILDAKGEMLERVGGKGNEPGRFSYVYSVTGDGENNIYGSDHQNHRLQKFDGDGKFITAWGSRGGGNGQFQYPRDVVHDGKEHLYAIDGNNFRVQKFDSGGNFAGAWGGRGTEPHQFQSMNAVHASSRDSVYVCEGSKMGVMRFNAAGEYRGFFGGRGVGEGYFCNPHTVTAGPDGSLYVADQNHRCIQKFDRDGNYLGKWGEQGSGEGRFINLGRIVADGRGMVYASDYGRDHLLKFDGDGNYLGRFGNFGRAGDLATDAEHNIIIIDHAHSRIVIFNPAGEQIAAWGDRDSIGYPAAVAADPGGGLFIADNRDWRLRHFDYQGRENFAAAGMGPAPGLLMNVSDMIFDRENTLLVCDGGAQRIQRFDAKGRFLMQWFLPRELKEHTPYPGSIAVDDENRILVADLQQGKIWKYRFVSAGFEPRPAVGLQSYSDKQRWPWLSLAGDSRVVARPISRRVARETVVAPAPESGELVPREAGPGDQVVLRGRGFSRMSRVEVAGLEQATRYVSPHELVFTVAGGGGPVFVREGADGPVSAEPLELLVKGRRHG